MRQLDRYVIRCFLLPFIYCFVGIASIWLILDMADKLPNLIDAHASPREILRFYRISLPEITVFCLPIALLLSLLYSLSRLSRSNEIVSMVTAGISVARILTPLMMLGILFSLISVALTYELAPESESKRKVMFDLLTATKTKTSDQNAVLFRNRDARRTWYFERMGSEGRESHGVQVLQQNEKGDPLWKVYARNVKFVPEKQLWMFSEGEILNLQPDGKIVSQQAFSKKLFTNFDETVWRIASADLKAQDLGVPNLSNYLYQNRDFPPAQLAPFQTELHNRWSRPWDCLLVMMIGGPLVVVFSRRGVLGGVANAFILFFVLIFLESLFSSLGKGARISPEAGAWSTPAIFFAIGLYLIVMRTWGRSLNPFKN